MVSVESPDTSLPLIPTGLRHLAQGCAELPRGNHGEGKLNPNGVASSSTSVIQNLGGATCSFDVAPAEFWIGALGFYNYYVSLTGLGTTQTPVAGVNVEDPFTTPSGFASSSSCCAKSGRRPVRMPGKARDRYHRRADVLLRYLDRNQRVSRYSSVASAPFKARL